MLIYLKIVRENQELAMKCLRNICIRKSLNANKENRRLDTRCFKCPKEEENKPSKLSTKKTN
jgi:hypothetical protein